jgi:hypothetical protein
MKEDNDFVPEEEVDVDGDVGNIERDDDGVNDDEFSEVGAEEDT